jgi:Antitoxin SocA-like, Panacea domain
MIRTGPEFQFDRNKFRELALYIATKTSPENLGAVKFNKVLYYSDMLHYVMKGQPITGATYRRRERGPTTDQLLFALRDLAKGGELQVSEVPFYGFIKKEYRALREPDLSKFSADEISLVDDVIQFVCEGHTAKAISEISHNLAWEATEPDAEIPYFTAFLMYPTEVSDMALSWAEKEAPSIEAERQRRNPLEYPLFRDLRARV